MNLYLPVETLAPPGAGVTARRDDVFHGQPAPLVNLQRNVKTIRSVRTAAVLPEGRERKQQQNQLRVMLL